MAENEGIPAVELQNVTKKFGEFTAVDDLSLTIGENTFFAMLGPSGCGKTTTLRMIGGFEDPTSGVIRLHGEDVTGLKPYRRAVNTVFQSYALFPHMTVEDNVAFGLKRRKVEESEIKRRVAEMLELVQLGAKGSAKPRQLSGGQQQRVALARALINHPRVLLLDEPLGALDLKLRKEMQIELKRIQQEVGVTFIHVTHDQEEAMTMADTIAVMNQGRIERIGSPAEIYEDPWTPFVASFLGASNLMNGTVSGSEIGLPNGAVIKLTETQAARCNGHATAQIGVRPEKISFYAPDDPNMPANRLTGVIVDTSFTGVSTHYLVEVGGIGQVAVVEQNLGDIHSPGEQVTVAWKPEHTFVVG
jgi:spermidine/putrescine transport system ATP-binding protein